VAEGGVEAIRRGVRGGQKGGAVMKLTFLTLTGADDNTDPKKMAELSERFPFVEWALLFSQAKAGVSRYPSLDWVENALPILSGCNLSAHLCGKWVDDANKGRITFLDAESMSGAFGRLQLNQAKGRLLKVLKGETDFWHCAFDKPIILGGPYQAFNIPTDAFMLHGVSPLFDCSGGMGILASEWPAPALDKYGKPLFCGYAGGLGPDNIEEELAKIEAVVGDAEIWVDMESKIRNNKDELDLEKCEQVLTRAKQWTDNSRKVVR
jgi:hypothetical protein